MEATNTITPRVPWNKGKLVGQKAPFKPKEIWAIRLRLQMEERTRELALFNLGIDSKLRACDLTALRVRDISICVYRSQSHSCFQRMPVGRLPPSRTKRPLAVGAQSSIDGNRSPKATVGRTPSITLQRDDEAVSEDLSSE